MFDVGLKVIFGCVIDFVDLGYKLSESLSFSLSPILIWFAITLVLVLNFLKTPQNVVQVHYFLLLALQWNRFQYFLLFEFVAFDVHRGQYHRSSFMNGLFSEVIVLRDGVETFGFDLAGVGRRRPYLIFEVDFEAFAVAVGGEWGIRWADFLLPDVLPQRLIMIHRRNSATNIV